MARRAAGAAAKRAASALAKVLKEPVRKALNPLGLDVVRVQRGTGSANQLELPIDFDSHIAKTVAQVKGLTLTSPERVAALCEAVRYLVRAGVQGAFVECGVWRGGSVLAMIGTLQSEGVNDRDIYLFDTFTAMPPPGPEDVDISGTPARYYHALLDSGQVDASDYAYLPLSSLKHLLYSTGYPPERLVFVQGLVEQTIPASAPEEIALLRLDTDYYSSTRHELEHLYPRIAQGGILIVDDYGHWQGARRATDEYLYALASQGIHLMLNRIDYSGRIAVVPSHAAVPHGRSKIPTRPAGTGYVAQSSPWSAGPAKS